MTRPQLEIDFKTADRLTTITLKEQREILKKQLDDYKKGGYLHPDDVDNHTRVILALDVVIDYFGG